jgi:RNA polymerase sigma factor (sigma-70 family)
VRGSAGSMRSSPRTARTSSLTAGGDPVPRATPRMPRPRSSSPYGAVSMTFPRETRHASGCTRRPGACWRTRGRSRKRREALQERLVAAEDSRPLEAATADREEGLVHEALRRLARVDREVLLLSEWEGLSPAQIAAVMGCGRVTARGRLHRARRRFRAAFEELREGRPRPANIQVSQRRIHEHV